MPRAQILTRAWWNRARGSNAVPIGLVVAIALTAIAATVRSSANRVDEITIDQERRIFTNELAERREQLVREAENVSAFNMAVNRIWIDFDYHWVHSRVGLRSKAYFGHDQVFILDPSDRIAYALEYDTGHPSAPAGRQEVAAVVDAIRGRPPSAPVKFEAASVDPETAVRRPARASRLQTFFGRPAIVAAVALIAADDMIAVPDGPPPILVTVEIIDQLFLATIGERLKIANLREVGAGPVPADDCAFHLVDDGGAAVARFAWTPQRPGAAIVRDALPFFAIALAGLALLAAFALRYMHRTAAAISAGEDRMRHLALHDSLSGLPNRTYFGERLESVIAQVQSGGAPAAVLCIDLDHFKDVNDTLGHHVGDQLIGAVTLRLRAIVRDEALVARLGGDEFAIITPGAADSATLVAISDRIIKRLCAPYVIMGHQIVIGASIGIAVIDRPSLGAADVMRYADIALYRAKNEGRRRACIYDDAMNADLLQRKDLENDLRRALDTDGLALAYQPVFSADGVRAVGVEALARWHHRERGDVPPAIFIPVAEHSGLIVQLGAWVLRRACLDAAKWPVTLAVNVSPLQFRQPDFADVVERILAETGFDPARLELEITESTLLGNVDSAEIAMRRLKALGVRLALDDFGTGYSSLLYLRRFPFDKLKIDSSFVRSIESAAESAPIVHAIVSLGRGLGMKVTAEGVETAEQHLFLRAAGVHFMQGFRFGRPEPAAALEARLARQARGGVADEPLARVG